MRWVILLILLTATASPTRATDASCDREIATAERIHAIPAGLLAAVGRIESGRADPATGFVRPWPWTINAEGAGKLFDTKADAIAAVRTQMAKGVRSIDVGCMQINLMHHPTAFASLDIAFDPTANVTYAATFLRQLFAQQGTWEKAVGAYHSGTPERAEPYAKKVMASWGDAPKTPLVAEGGGGKFNSVSAAPVRRTVSSDATGRDLESYRSRPISTWILAMRATRRP